MWLRWHLLFSTLFSPGGAHKPEPLIENYFISRRVITFEIKLVISKQWFLHEGYVCCVRFICFYWCLIRCFILIKLFIDVLYAYHNNSENSLIGFFQGFRISSDQTLLEYPHVAGCYVGDIGVWGCVKLIVIWSNKINGLNTVLIQWNMTGRLTSDGVELLIIVFEWHILSTAAEGAFSVPYMETKGQWKFRDDPIDLSKLCRYEEYEDASKDLSSIYVDY